MRNARTLVERIALSKAIEGELRTFDVDLHVADGNYEVYIFDPDEAFEAPPFAFTTYEAAKAMFERCVQLIVAEPVSTTETPFDFADRIYDRLGVFWA